MRENFDDKDVEVVATCRRILDTQLYFTTHLGIHLDLTQCAAINVIMIVEFLV